MRDCTIESQRQEGWEPHCQRRKDEGKGKPRSRPVSWWCTENSICGNLLVVPASASEAECPLPPSFVSFPQGLRHCSYSSSFDNCPSLGWPWSLEGRKLSELWVHRFVFTHDQKRISTKRKYRKMANEFWSWRKQNGAAEKHLWFVSLGLLWKFTWQSPWRIIILGTGAAEEMAQWLKHLLLLQRSQVQFPEPYGGCQPSVNSSSMGAIATF